MSRISSKPNECAAQIKTRSSLLDELAAYRPFDDREAAMRERMVAFVNVYDDCFERSQLRGHVTGSAWILRADRAAVVLLHHRKLGRWLQPGGHADGDPDVRRVALREAVEETGIAGLRLASESIYDIDAHDIPARLGEPAHVHYDVRFAFVAPAGALPRVSDESHEVRWVPLAELERFNIDDSVKRLAAKSGSLHRGEPLSGPLARSDRGAW